jgi:hypothetical protein
VTPPRLLLGTLLLLAACGGEAPQVDAPVEVAPSAPPPGRTYERALVFTTLRSDSVLLVPWLVEARARPGGVDRRARGWLLRGGEWEPFLAQEWETPPTNAPWRILPQGPLRLIVGLDDALERVAYIEGAQRLEVALGASLAEWSGRRGEVFQLADAGLTLGEGSTPGIVLDMNRVRETAEGRSGDWLFVVSGDSLQVVLHTPLAGGNQEEGAWRGWVRLDFREVPVSMVTVDWAALRAFDRARRDVPVSWTLTSADAPLEGVLEVRTSHLEAGAGAGPLLPLDGFFEVEGSVVVEGNDYPVRGLYRHTQGG